MKNASLLLVIACLLPAQPALAQRSVDEILREYQAAPRISWIIPLPYQKEGANANPVEDHLVQFLTKRPDRLSFWDGTVAAETTLPTQGAGSARLMPKLRAAAEIRVFAAEMLFYPEVKDSPFSGDLLKGTLGHRPSGTFLFGLVFDPRHPSEKSTHLLSTPRGPTSKNQVQLGLTLEASYAREALLRGDDVFAFIHLYGHGIQNEHGHTAMVLPRHQFSAATFTGLSGNSLITAAEALETFLNATLGSAEEFIRKDLVRPEQYERIVKDRRESDKLALRADDPRRRKLGIVIVMETCRVTYVKNPKGERRPHTMLSAAVDAKTIQEVVRKQWLDRFEKTMRVPVETEIQIVDVADPGRRLAVSIDHQKWDAVPTDERIQMSVYGVDGSAVRMNPLDYGLLAPRIPVFLEESVHAASLANVPYRLSDVVNDIQYYKERYLSDKPLFKSPMDEFMRSAPVDYWRRMKDRHASKDKNDNSLPIINPDFAAVYVLFSPEAKVGPSKYQVDLQWRGSTRWNNQSR